MKKTLIVITIAMLTFVGKAYAEVSFGVSAAVTKINSSGTAVSYTHLTLTTILLV